MVKSQLLLYKSNENDIDGQAVWSGRIPMISASPGLQDRSIYGLMYIVRIPIKYLIDANEC